MADGKNRSVKIRTVYAVFAVLCFGILLIALNVYQLYNLSWSQVLQGFPSSGRRVVWIQSKEIYHLNHVMNVFDKMGYETVHSTTPLSRWDVMWSFDFPFTYEHMPILKNLKNYQLVNHLPGSGFITLKVELATSKLRWIPKAFQIPNERKAMMKEARLNPRNQWVQKSNDHRGIKVVSIEDLDHSAKESFVQLYVSNPLLVDGRKFDIGVYVVVTSVNPLRVYVYEEEILVRFCQKDYKPMDFNEPARYIVGADYDPPSKMPSLQSYFNHGHFSRKQALFGYLRSKGKNAERAWKDVRQAVREAFIAKQKELTESFSGYKSTHNFFELVRFDFIFDGDMTVWLLEVNMSPNLSSGAHSENAVMYEQVLFHAFQVTGIATLPFRLSSDENEALMVQDRDIMVNSNRCRTAACFASCQPECELCIQCISDDMKTHLRRAFLEHTHRGNYRRVLPIPKTEVESLGKQDLNPTGKSNQILRSWFESKCYHNPSWCH